MNRVSVETIDLAKAVFVDEPGRFEDASDEHVLFRYTEEGVMLVFYPHRMSGAGYFGLRVRMEPCRNVRRAKHLIDKLVASHTVKAKNVDFFHARNRLEAPHAE